MIPIPPLNSYPELDVQVGVEVDVEMKAGVDEEAGNEEGVSWGSGPDWAKQADKEGESITADMIDSGERDWGESTQIAEHKEVDDRKSQAEIRTPQRKRV